MQWHNVKARCKGHMRQQLFDNAQTFEIAVNEALAPYQVKFSPLSKPLQDGQRESIVPGSVIWKSKGRTE
jgi:hypothetical protein